MFQVINQFKKQGLTITRMPWGLCQMIVNLSSSIYLRYLKGDIDKF